jgi:hypothetical protein
LSKGPTDRSSAPLVGRSDTRRRKSISFISFP